MIVALGCDHAGFTLKATVKDFFESKAQVMDFGAFDEESSDYPDIAFKTAQAVSEGKADVGVLLCGAGIGMSITANKIAGIRAAVCNDVESARLGKSHNNINVLCMGGRIISPDQARAVIKTWLDTSFEGGQHLGRINKIAAKESANLTADFGGGRVVVFNHPLVQHKVGIIRDKNTSVKEFRELVQEIAGLMVYEITRSLPLSDTSVETPVGQAAVRVLAGKKLAVVPVLRAGLGMVDGILQLIPNAKVGHIGLYRDPETLSPVEYYCKLPQDINERDVLFLSPCWPREGPHRLLCLS